MEPAFAHGCAGKLVLRLQEALAKPPFAALAPKEVDGNFGDSTREAVRQVQAKLKQPVTGTVNAELWKAVLGQEWPENFRRSLQLLGARGALPPAW